MKIGISQPTFLPWAGYFGLIDYVDEFIFLDNVQFERGGWQQRNYIKVNKNKHLITIPVKKNNRDTDYISNVEIDYSQNFSKKLIKTITHSYSKSVYFNKYSEVIFSILESKDILLKNMNIKLIKKLCEIMKIKKKFSLSSDLNLDFKKNELILNLCKSKNAKIYISTIRSKEYLDINKFNENNILLQYYNIDNLVYEQLEKNFISNLSVIDLIFNKGEGALGLIRKNFRIHG